MVEEKLRIDTYHRTVLTAPAIAGLLAETRPRHLEHDEAIATIQRRKGLIPVAFDHVGGNRIIWLDVGDYRFPEYRCMESLSAVIAKRGPGDAFSTDVGILASEDILTDYLCPTGFIFHMARCGSTLLANSLANSPHNLVMKEPTLFREASVMRYFTDNWTRPPAATEENLRMLRNLVLLMGRQRIALHEDYFLKMTSWNTLFMDFIAQAFPEVPSLFLYRDPSEVLVSLVHKKGPYASLQGTSKATVLTNCPADETAKMSDLAYYVQMEVNYLTTALRLNSDRLRFLDYRHLTSQNLELILRCGFNYTPEPDQLTLMQNEFGYYSKRGSEDVSFQSDQAEKRQLVTPEIRQAAAGKLAELYEGLGNLENNLAIQLQPVDAI
ncbi:hypothetical protein [Planctomycetes bacterium K23_9]|uniref:Sulfotransferase domain protein n=1 Tax=Stieleria marina TaxID=1930275 RepID=A0A517P0K1_9BACT|nr:hypothetical protein K239x_49150 [Planctomycetes bacterium K23_9]